MADRLRARREALVNREDDQKEIEELEGDRRAGLRILTGQREAGEEVVSEEGRELCGG